MDNLSAKLKEYAKNGNYPFHMPGHKRRLSGAYSYDITEIDGFDNLNNPHGIIQSMNSEIAAIYGSKVSFFTVGGSTVGNLSAISAAADMGDTIIVARNCHKSVINAAYLRKLDVEYIIPKMYNDNIIGSVSLTQVREAVDKLKNKDIIPKAVVISSPTYEGVVTDIEPISDYLHTNGIPLIVDSAHGAHLHFNDSFPRDYIRCIDICIMSAHKTLPVLTQAAYIHINSQLVKADDVAKFLHIYQTSSPSYVIMESMSRALEIIDEKNIFDRFINNLKKFYESCHNLKALSIEPYRDDRDISKIIIYTNGYMSADKLASILRDKYSMEMEMTCENYLLALTSIMDDKTALDRLYEALLKIDTSINTKAKLKEHSPLVIREHKKAFNMYEADRAYEYVEPLSSIGKVAARAIISYPPGIAIVMPGEVIEEEDAYFVMNNLNKIETLSDGKLCVLTQY